MRPPWEYGRDGVVVIDDLVQLSSNNGIMLWDWTDFTPFSKMERWRDVAAIIEEHHSLGRGCLVSAIEKALAFYPSDFLNEALCNGWPDGTRGPINFERFLLMLKQEEVRRINRGAKRQHMAIRRREFGLLRSQLVLQMLDAGVPYACAHPGCDICVDLTIDHKLALSRGGGDEIANLQFMCRAHNSQKSDG